MASTEITDFKSISNLIQRFDQPIMILNDLGQIIDFNSALNDKCDAQNFSTEKEFITSFLVSDARSNFEEYVSKQREMKTDQNLQVEVAFGTNYLNMEIITVSQSQTADLVFLCVAKNTDANESNELESLRSDSLRHKIALDVADQAIWDTNNADDSSYVSDNWHSIRGVNRDINDPKKGRDFIDEIHPDDRPIIEKAYKEQLEGSTDIINQQYRFKNDQGNWEWILSRGKILTRDKTGAPIRIIGTDTNITELKRIESELEIARKTLEVESNKDSLTELKNRKKFFIDLEDRFESVQETNEQLIIGHMDLDGFKLVNDVYGHAAGDQLLIEIANRLNQSFPDSFNVYRLGGDEFALILHHNIENTNVEKLGEQICDVIAAEFNIDEARLSISASIGFAKYSDQVLTAQSLFEHADYALYRAKYGGKDRAIVLDEHHLTEMNHQAQIQAETQKPNFWNELSLVYQPIVCTDTKEVLKFEALARWKSPSLGHVSPAHFVPVLERTGSTERLTFHLLAKALNALRSWPEHISLSFNLSANDIAKPDIGLRLGSIIRSSNIDPKRVEFEITETALMRNLERVEVTVHYLKSLGVKLSIDDFGTGNTSLSQLHLLKVDTLKIDRSFISGLNSEVQTTNSKIVKSIIQMCKDLDINCVAEGVETDTENKALVELRCTYLQGFFFGKGTTLEQLPMLMQPTRKLMRA